MARASIEEKHERRIELERSVLAVNHKYASLFSGGDGEDILSDLEAQFGGSCIKEGDPYMTHARAGAQEVLLYIRQRMRTPTDA
jgi:hypothetical protein|tara:strand:+ start:4113 stop:4364 length:252 start_codon:yes stop_codon:yes gene_type:complete